MELLTFPISVKSEPIAVYEVRWNLLAALLLECRRLTAGENGDKLWRGDWEEPTNYCDQNQETDDMNPYEMLTSVDEILDVLNHYSPPDQSALPIVIDDETLQFDYEIMNEAASLTYVEIKIPTDYKVGKVAILKYFGDMQDRLHIYGEDSVTYKNSPRQNRIVAWARSMFSRKLGFASTN